MKKWTAVMALAGLAVAGAWAQGTRPNILFVMSDDHAAHAISAYDGRLNQTPGIDRLAEGGMRFSRMYAVNSICTPSRATILTGQYSHVNEVPVFNALDPARQTVAKLLQGAGYHTAMIGKWHLGSDPQGFDHWEIFPGQGAYFNPKMYSAAGEKVYKGEYATELVTRLAVEQLKARPRDKPFFMMVHHKAPHRPWVPTERLAKIWRERTVPEPESLFEKHDASREAVLRCAQKVARDMSKTDVKFDPPEGLAGDALTRWKYQRYMQDYLACVQGVDESMGTLLDTLEAEGLADNTLVIYTSDQGFFLGEHGLYDKRFMYDESIKMPFLMRWPGKVKAGAVQDAMAINCDFAPTFLAVAGVPVPDDMQGVSMVPLFDGGRPPAWRESVYYRYYHDPGHHNTARHYGVRTETHKLIHFDKLGKWELYDLVKDPAETRNVYDAPEMQATVTRLKEELARLQREYKDTENRYADPKTWPQTPPQYRGRL